MASQWRSFLDRDLATTSDEAVQNLWRRPHPRLRAVADADLLLTRLHTLDGELPEGRPDLRASETLATTRRLAEQLLEQAGGPADLWALEQASTAPGSGISRVGQLAVKLARSRAYLLASRPLTVSVVIPAYGETIRILPRGAGDGQHPDGEDFVVEKRRQVEWLFAGTPSAYDVVFVDDLSRAEPQTSGDAIRAVVERDGIPGFRVLDLADGVRNEKHGDGLVAAALRGVELPKNTRKAGAVYYGFAKTVEANGTGADHLLVLTDCDLSVDLGQVGNLVAPVADVGAGAAAGSRRLPESVLEIEPGRNTRANAARYFREILLSGLLPRDTQCGAKAFAAQAVAEVVEGGMEVLDFSFDIELLTKLALRFGAERIVPVPVAWFDSSELTTTDSSVHLTIMQAQLTIARHNRTGSGPVFDQTAALADRLTSDERVWLTFLDRLAAEPALLASVERFDTSVLPQLTQLASR